MEDIFQAGERVVMEHDRIHPFHRRQIDRQKERERKKQRKTNVAALMLSTPLGM